MNDSFHILIVEDEVLFALFMEMRLSEMGYRRCLRVVTGEEALTMVKKHQFQAVIMDIRLGGDLDGIQTVEKIRETTSVPVIFSTGYRDEETLELMEKLKPAAVIFKPVNFTELKDALDRIRDGLKE